MSGPLLEVEMFKKWMPLPLWREAHVEVKMYKTPELRSIFRSCDVENVHAVVVRSTFPSQNVQSTPGSEHFWKLTSRKSTRCCGAKHISMSKVERKKSDGYGPLLHIQMSVGVAGARDGAPGQSEQSERVLWQFQLATAHYNYNNYNYNELHYTTSLRQTTLH